MSLIQRGAWCTTCQATTLHTKPRINHVLHLVLTLITFGMWGVVWIILGLRNRGKPALCTRCGMPAPWGENDKRGPRP